MVIRKDVINLTMPIIAEQTFIMIMGVVNAIMAGHLGKEVVSAIGMVDSINNMFIAFFSALAVGGTVVVAHYIGQKNNNSANQAAQQALLSGILMAVAITIGLFIFRYEILRLLFGSAEEDVMNNAFVYLTITLATYPLIALTAIACGVLRGAGDTKTPMKVTITMNILNIIFSYVLIYGLNLGDGQIMLRIPAFGIKGAACGIAIARVIGAVLISYTLLDGSRLIKLTIDRSIKFDFNILNSIFGVGFPASVESLLFFGGKLITQIFIVGMGTASIAANYVASSVFTLFNIPGGALSIAATTMVGQHMGKGEIDEAKSTMLYLTKLGSVCLLFLGSLMVPLAHGLASLYTTSYDVIEIAVPIIRVSALSMPTIWVIAFIVPAGLKGAGDAKYTMIVSIVGMWLFRVTLGYILGVPLKLGVMGVWIGMFADWVVRSILFYIRLQRGKWREKVVIKNLEEPVEVSG